METYRSTGSAPRDGVTKIAFAMCEPVVADLVTRLLLPGSVGYGVTIGAADIHLNVTTSSQTPTTLYLWCQLTSAFAQSPAVVARIEQLGLVRDTTRGLFTTTRPRTREGASEVEALAMALLGESARRKSDMEVSIAFRSTAVKPLQVIGFVATLSVLVIPAAYWTATRTGPARQLIDWQTSWFGNGYYPTTTFGALFVMNTVIVVGVLGLLSWTAKALGRVFRGSKRR